MSKSSLKDFEVLSRLGKGSYGIVQKVRRRKDQVIYVLKQISIRQLGARGQQEALNEVNILASLSHPYVVKYYDSFIENQTLHILMEFCEHGDLSAVVTNQRGRLLPEPKIWRYLIQMCLGLEYIHSKKILHRDIKTLNVFLAREDSLRIGDLGVAKRLMNTAAFAHTMVGTPYYLSPELCEDKPYNIKSDIWALGCVLYELCTLKHPFEANNQGALFMKIIKAAFAPISDQYSVDLRRVVEACLSRDYRKRPSTETILKTPGMRERAIGLNISIPQGSVLDGSPVPVPAVVDHPIVYKSDLPVIIEEEKVQKRPTSVQENKRKPSVIVGPAHAKEFAEAKPKPKMSQAAVAVVEVKFSKGNGDAEKKPKAANNKELKPKAVAPPGKIGKPQVQEVRVIAASPVVKNGMPPQRVIKTPVAQVHQPIARVGDIQPVFPGKAVVRPASAVPSTTYVRKQ